MNMENVRLRVAIQKSGRLSDGSVDLLERSGIRLRFTRDKMLARSVDGLPLDVFLVRDDDIAGFIEDGVCDVGIVGENVYKEQLFEGRVSGNLQIMRRLGFGRCRLCLATIAGGDFAGIDAYLSKFSAEKKLRIATSFPSTVRHYLEPYKDRIKIVNMKGAVELAPRMSIADAVVDLVSTGASLKANGLDIVETLLHSEAIMLSKNGEMGSAKLEVFQRWLTRLDGVLHAKGCKYVMLHIAKDKVEKISALLSADAVPTVLPLQQVEQEDDHLVAVHIVSREEVFWETIEGLKKLGAERILVLPIEKMMI